MYGGATVVVKFCLATVFIPIRQAVMTMRAADDELPPDELLNGPI